MRWNRSNTKRPPQCGHVGPDASEVVGLNSGDCHGVGSWCNSTSAPATHCASGDNDFVAGHGDGDS
jgi:hypothetical protein